jgi:hypothetical protein
VVAGRVVSEGKTRVDQADEEVAGGRIKVEVG